MGKRVTLPWAAWLVGPGGWSSLVHTAVLDPKGATELTDGRPILFEREQQSGPPLHFFLAPHLNRRTCGRGQWPLQGASPGLVRPGATPGAATIAIAGLQRGREGAWGVRYHLPERLPAPLSGLLRGVFCARGHRAYHIQCRGARCDRQALRRHAMKIAAWAAARAASR